MRRREFISGLGGAAIAWPLAARAQQVGLPTIGLISSFSEDTSAHFVAGFRRGLAEEHYVEGRNIVIEYRWAEGHFDGLPGLAAELVDRRVSVIAAIGYSAAAAAKAATASIPIVFSSAVDPVEQKLVKSLARPGGNLTGVFSVAANLVAKRFGLLRDLVPTAQAIGLLVNPRAPTAKPQIVEAEGVAPAAGFKLIVVSATNESELDRAFASLRNQGIGGLVVSADPFFFVRPERIVRLAAREGVPTVYNARAYAVAGGLMSYSADLHQTYAQVGRYVGKVLAGATPADLPIVQASEFELVINLKTAGTLGLSIPPSLLAQAQELIE